MQQPLDEPYLATYFKEIFVRPLKNMDNGLEE